MKKHLSDFLHLFVLPLGSMIVGAAILVLPLLYALGGCEIVDSDRFVGSMDTKSFRGKVIYQVIASPNNKEITFLFTDTTSLTLNSFNCQMIIKK